MARSKLADRETFLEAYKEAAGNISYACDVAGICRQTFYNWMDNFDTFKKKVDEIDDRSIDFAESKLKKLIKHENLRAIMFYLKTKGKKRGYIEKVEVEMDSDYVPVQIVLPDNGRIK